jgi:transcriptional regulator with XRE-family HTH domain
MSVGESIGAMIRRLRLEHGWSQQRLAELLNDASGHPTNTRHDVYRWESGKRVPRSWLPALARVFEVPLELLELATVRRAPSDATLATLRETSPGTPSATPAVTSSWGIASAEDDEVRRRDLLNLVGGAAVLAVSSNFGEDVRQGLERVLATENSGRDIDEWERSVDAYGVEIGSAPPSVMVQHLLTDIHEVNGLLNGRISELAQRRLLRVATHLAVLTAVTIIATGAPQASRRWWRTARRTAERLDDAELDAFVLGQQAVLAMYCGYSHRQGLDLADEALSGRELVCAGAASATAAKAQALSVLGRVDEANQALDHLRGIVDRLPDNVTDPSATYFAYPEYKLRHVESYVKTRLGQTHDAAQAQDAAVHLYPAGKYRGLSQVELHRAACMIMDGYIEEGIAHAACTLNNLSGELRRDNLIQNVAQSAIVALPCSARSLDSARELQRLISSEGRNA